MSVHAVIAARGGPGAKSRLSGRLDVQAREALVEAMLADMLAVLRTVSGIARLWVVTPTPSLSRLAGKAGASVIMDSGATGLNDAFELARARIALEAPEASALLLPGDLPLLMRDEAEAFVRAIAPGLVVIAPASADGGTGALALPARSAFPLAFGPDSFALHVAAAADHGYPCRTIAASSLGLDIDRPGDLDAAARHGTSGETGLLLNHWRAAA